MDFGLIYDEIDGYGNIEDEGALTELETESKKKELQTFFLLHYATEKFGPRVDKKKIVKKTIFFGKRCRIVF